MPDTDLQFNLISISPLFFFFFVFGSLPNSGLHRILASKGQLNYMKSIYQQATKRIFKQLCYNNVEVNVHNLCI